MLCRCGLLEEGAEAAEGCSELVGVVGGGIFQLLEEGVDGSADFGGAGGFGLLAVGDVQGVYGHGGLLGGAFVGQGDVFGVVGDLLEHF